MFDIDFIHKKDSQLSQIMDVYASKNPSLNINKYSISNFESNKFDKNKNDTQEQLSNIIIIEEIDSFLSTEEIFENVSTLAKPDSVKIIMTANHNFYNVIQWIRKGATDVLLTSTLTEKALLNSILSGQSYLRSKNKTKNVEIKTGCSNTRIEYAKQKINIPKHCNWQEIGNEDNFEMTLVTVSFAFDNTTRIISSDKYDRLYEAAKAGMTRLVQYFGGTMWFWNGSTGAMVFHFEDHVNTAITACIHMINQLTLTYMDKLKMKNIPTFKIAVHTGTDIYRPTQTEDLHSDVINFTCHLLSKFTPKNTLCISDDVYKKLSVRLVDYFTECVECEDFEGHKIYKY